MIQPRGVAALVRRVDAQRKAVSEQTEIDRCTKEADDAHQTANRDQSDYDKQLLTISVAFLGVSVAFIKDVVPLAEATNRLLLYSSFIFLVTCICLVLMSYQVSIAGQIKAKDYWEQRGIGSVELVFPHKHATFVRVLNVVTGLFFAVGIILAVSFVITNMKNEVRMKTTQIQEGSLMKGPIQPEQVQKGSTMKTPPPPPARPIPPPNPPRK